MKIIIPSKGRAGTISTHLLFEGTGYDYTIVLHTEEERQAYLKNPTIRKETLIVSNAPFNISAQRQWILEQLIEEGEWFLTMDDNVDGFQGYPQPFYDLGRIDVDKRKYSKDIAALCRRPMHVMDFLKYCEEMIEYAEEIKTGYCGFAVNDNYFFRTKKYSLVAYICSKVALIKKCGVQYDLMIKAMDDYSFTARNLRKFGKVLKNNFIYPVAQHYESGGIGTYKDRLPKKLSDAELLMKQFPGLFSYYRKIHGHPKAELILKFHHVDQVAAWNRFMNGRK